jgi:23S rRNA pseudouridine1911/1915/1917 synthase
VGPRIIAETNDVLAVDKPAGLIVHSDGRTEEPSLAEWLIEKYPVLADVGDPWVSPQGERVRVAGIVHRLDRTTSGVVLVAKTPTMFSYLKHEFKARRVEKTYHAFVYGHMKAPSGRIVAEIVRSSEKPKRWYARPCEENDVRAAVTDWRVLRRLYDRAEPISELELSPKTGRTHQIRVHLASIGHPILSDHLYAPGRPKLLGFTRPALHAYSISITLRGKQETFIASLPAHFRVTPTGSAVQ